MITVCKQVIHFVQEAGWFRSIAAWKSSHDVMKVYERIVIVCSRGSHECGIEEYLRVWIFKNESHKRKKLLILNNFQIIFIASRDYQVFQIKLFFQVNSFNLFFSQSSKYLVPLLWGLWTRHLKSFCYEITVWWFNWRNLKRRWHLTIKCSANMFLICSRIYLFIGLSLYRVLYEFYIVIFWLVDMSCIYSR